MALQVLQAGLLPLGQFDVLDSLTALKGGEVVTFTSVSVPSTDKAASDVFDGYAVPGGAQKRPVLTTTLSTGKRPLMLSDDGISGYGTLFGTLIGSSVGQISDGPNTTNGTVIGPSTYAGSGKLTCWTSPGLYNVSLDAVDSTASTGLAATNTNINVGDKIYATTAGLLTANSLSSFEGGLAVGRFVEFSTGNSLVTTSSRLVATLNSPSGNVSSVVAGSFKYATIWFNGSSI